MSRFTFGTILLKRLAAPGEGKKSAGMRPADLPYVISIVIGALLGIALFVVLAPRLEPQRQQVKLETKPAQLPLDRLYIVDIGPVDGERRAAEIAQRLKQAGFGARITRRAEPRVLFHAISPATPLRIAERRRAALASLGFRPRLRGQAGGLVQVWIGSSASQREAQVLAKRIRGFGYAATVVRENGTTYFLRLGPHSRAVVDAITGTLRSQTNQVARVTVLPGN